MDSQRPKRARKPAVKFEERPNPALSKGQKITKNASRTAKKTALQAVAAEPIDLPAADLIQQPLATYNPYLKLRKIRGKPSQDGRSLGKTILQNFQSFLTAKVLLVIVTATNSYAANKREGAEILPFARSWRPVTSAEVLRYVGVLIYMGIHIEREVADYWKDAHRMGRFMSRNRYQQIHRYLSLRDTTVCPRQPGEGYYWRLEPVAGLIRQACIHNWEPGSYLAVDESMVAFRGRSSHTIKMKNKPIKQGFKIWVLGDRGYVWSWLWYSPVEGTENLKKKNEVYDLAVPLAPVSLAPTFGVIITLAKELRKLYTQRVFCLFLDNLFLSVDVAHALLAVSILCTGTTRKNAAGVPYDLIQLKEQNSGMVWNSTVARIVGFTLCFVWQDNNAVLGITTAHTLGSEHRILRNRKRPKETSTNARIVRPVFGDNVRKQLYIPTAIDDYNYHMNAVDRSNQLRKVDDRMPAV